MEPVAAKGEAAVEAAHVGHVVSKLGAEDRERVETGAPQSLVAHPAILSHRAGGAEATRSACLAELLLDLAVGA